MTAWHTHFGSRSRLAIVISAAVFAAGSTTPASVLAQARGGVELQEVGPVDAYIVGLRTPPLALSNGGPNVSQPLDRLPSGRLDVRSESAQAYVRELEEEQAEFLQSASQQVGRTLGVVADLQFQHAFNGMVLNLTAAEAAQLRAHPDVLLVEEKKLLPLDTDAQAFLGAPTIWNGANTPNGFNARGDGVVVGIIDSGANLASPSFSATDKNGFTHTNPLGAGNYLGLCQATPSACNAKLIGGYDYADAVLDPTPGNAFRVVNGREAPGFEDENGHGSNTASTAAGNVRDATFNGVLTEISGIAPHANLVVFDACHTPAPPSTQGSCFNAFTLAAINQAVADGVVDVINYSIGGGTAPWSEANSLAFLAAQNAGIFVAASAGNSGPGPNTLGHVEPWTTTVANTTHPRVFGFDFDLTGPGAPPANTQDVVLKPGGTPISTVAFDDAPLIVSPTFANGSTDGCAAFPANFFRRPATPTGVQGIAVLQLDGDTSACGSVARRTAALNAGAAGVIFIDNVPLNLGAADTSYSMIESIWNNVAAAIAADPGNATVDISNVLQSLQVPAGADWVSNSSSRGPHSGNYLKPDLGAPGSDILDAIARWDLTQAAPSPGVLINTPAGANAVALYSGTSMASPHIAGSAALLRNVRPAWTPMQIKSALLTTALPALKKQDGVTDSDPFDRGSGRVDLTRAAKVGFVMDESGANFLAANPATGGNPSTLNLANFQNGACVGTCSFTRSIRSVATSAVTWTLAVEGFAGAGTTTPASINLGASATSNFTLNVDVTALPQNVWQFGSLVLTPSNPALPTARMPIALRAAAPDIASTAGVIAVTAPADSVVTRPLPISNVGNPTLQYAFVEGGQSHVLFNQGPFSGSGYLSGRFAGAGNTGAYASDDFVVYSQASVASLRADGFVLPGGTNLTTTTAPTITFEVYEDDGGVPAGAPEGVGDAPVWAYTAASNAAGITVTGNNIGLNLATAGAPALNLGPGRYWLLVYPNMIGNGAGNAAANPLWAWRHVGVGPSVSGPAPQTIQPSLDDAWGAVTGAGLAGVINGGITCGVDFATLDSSSGDLGANETDTLTVTFDTDGLAPGVYSGYLCASTNGTDPDEPLLVVPVSLTVTSESLFQDGFEDPPVP